MRDTDTTGAMPWSTAWSLRDRLVPRRAHTFEVRVPDALVGEVVAELRAVRAIEAGAAPANDNGAAVATTLSPEAFAARFRGRR